MIDKGYMTLLSPMLFFVGLDVSLWKFQIETEICKKRANDEVMLASSLIGLCAAVVVAALLPKNDQYCHMMYQNYGQQPFFIHLSTG